jgi:uncharacterized membrane protein YhaH (DUF805 family)
MNGKSAPRSKSASNFIRTGNRFIQIKISKSWNSKNVPIVAREFLQLLKAVFLPGLAVGVRRLHDIGRSGWFLLIALIPIIGGILLVVFWCIEGQTVKNKYGYSPK